LYRKKLKRKVILDDRGGTSKEKYLLFLVGSFYTLNLKNHFTKKIFIIYSNLSFKGVPLDFLQAVQHIQFITFQVDLCGKNCLNGNRGKNDQN